MGNYIPEPVPSSESIVDLQGYLRDELSRIAIEFRQAPAYAYAGMVSEDVVPAILTTVPIPFAVFNEITPTRPFNMLADLVAVTLTPLSGGQFYGGLNATVSAVNAGIQVFIEFRVNGAQARTIAIDPSNQTAFSTVSYQTFVELKRGDVISVVVYASGSDTVNFEDVSLALFRVSDAQD